VILRLSGALQDGVTKLFRLVQGQGFQVEAAGVQPHFFDMNEDTPSVPRQWCLEVGDVETDVSDNFAFDQAARRVGWQWCKHRRCCMHRCVCVTIK
jgi:hypothetical protein